MVVFRYGVASLCGWPFFSLAHLLSDEPDKRLVGLLQAEMTALLGEFICTLIARFIENQPTLPLFFRWRCPLL